MGFRQPVTAHYAPSGCPAPAGNSSEESQHPTLTEETDAKPRSERKQAVELVALKPFSFSGHADTGQKPPVTPHPTASCQNRDRELDLSWCQSRQSPEPAQSTRRPQQCRAEASGLRGSHAPGARQPTVGRGLAPACIGAPLLVSAEGGGHTPRLLLSLHNLAGCEVRWKHLSPAD
ncbi:hypothetical protein D623_10025026 [Myotis brandtii]|uniref:Uncharacterized protein n=1 Tax=Myotis brandtii TaxID=109478 RepID=S7Q1M0_MYOBR|nr:hypothetical protein D623_10025026 [Myotis brandtii]